MKIGTKIVPEILMGYHGQLYAQSGHVTKYRAHIEAGTIDSDYRGTVFVVMSNNGDSNIDIKVGDCIAQLVITKGHDIAIEVKDQLSEAICNKNGFCSTCTNKLINHKTTPTPVSTLLPSDIPILQQQPTIAAAATLQDDHSPVCNVDISHDLFVDTQIAMLVVHGNHPTKELMLEDSETWNNRVIITTCKSGSPA